MARLRASWRTSLPGVQQPRNPQSESISRSPYQDLLQADSDLLQHSAAAGPRYHVGARPRAGRRERTRDVGGPQALLTRALRELVRNAHGVPRAPDVAKVIRRALAGACAVLAPFVAGQALVWKNAICFRKGDPGGRALGGVAVGRVAALVLRAQAMNHEAQATA